MSSLTKPCGAAPEMGRRLHLSSSRDGDDTSDIGKDLEQDDARGEGEADSHAAHRDGVD